MWSTIIDEDIDFFDTAPPFFDPPAVDADDAEWGMYERACEEVLDEWQGERLRVDYEIPYFHLTSLFLHICTSTQGWLSSLCDLLAIYHSTDVSSKDFSKEWALAPHLQFLHKTLHIDISASKSLLEPLRCQFAVRNAIVHSPPLFHFSSAWGHTPHPKKGLLVGSGAVPKRSRDGNLRLNEKYVLAALDRGMELSRKIRQKI